MRLVVARSLLVALVTPCVMVLGCTEADEFSCTKDAECVDGATAGHCELAGVCSFPDESCVSGRKYAAYAGSNSDSCVSTALVRAGSSVFAEVRALQVQREGGEERLIAGINFERDLDLGVVPHETGRDDRDFALARLSLEGAPLDNGIVHLGGEGPVRNDEVLGVVVTQHGDVRITGSFKEGIKLDPNNGSDTHSPGESVAEACFFVAAYSPFFDYRGSITAPCYDDAALGNAIAVAADDSVVVGGWCAGELLFPNIEEVQCDTIARDAMVVRFTPDPQNNPVGEAAVQPAPFGNAGRADACEAIASWGGEFVAVGAYDGIPLSQPESLNDEANAFLLSTDSGRRRILEASEGHSSRACAVVADGDRVYVAGEFTGRIAFDDNDFADSPGQSGFLAAYEGDEATFRLVWAESFPSFAPLAPLSDACRLSSIVLDAERNIFVAGHFCGETDLGEGPLVSLGACDGFVLARSPNAEHLWAETFGGSGRVEPLAITVDTSGHVYVAGKFDGTLSLGARSITSNAPANHNGFLLRIDR